jgi:hypothetical protein
MLLTHLIVYTSFQKTETAFVHTGASNNYLCPDAPHETTHNNLPTVTVGEPGGGFLRSTGSCNLTCPKALPAAKSSHILPGIHTSLVSVGKFCDANCFAVFTQDKVHIYNSNEATQKLLDNLEQKHEIALNGERDQTNGLWWTSLQKQQVNSMLKTTTIEEQMQFLHAAAGYPVPSTWIQAIQKGYYISWPGLTAENVQRYLPKSPIMSWGHIGQLRKNTNSTKIC